MYLRAQRSSLADLTGDAKAFALQFLDESSAVEIEQGVNPFQIVKVSTQSS